MTDDPGDGLPPDPFPDLPVHDGAQLGRDLASVVAVAFGALLHVMAGALVLTAELVAPGWAVLALGLVWVAGGALLWRLRRWPIVTLLVPFATLGLVWLALRAGAAWLGWGA